MTKPPIILAALLMVAGTQAAAKMRPIKDSQRKAVAQWRQRQRSQFFFDGKREQLFGSPQSAHTAFKLALWADPNCDACYYELSSIYGEQRNYKDAATAAHNAYTLDSTNFWYTQNYAKLAFVTGNIATAEKLYWKCIVQKPRMEELYAELLDVYGIQRNFDKQLSLLDYYELYFGQDATSLSMRQQIYYKMGDRAQAAQQAVLLADKFPSSQRYCLAAAELFLQQNEDSTAHIFLLRAAAIDSTNADYQMAQADYYRRQERFPDYFAMLRKAFVNPQSSLPAKLYTLEFLQQFPQFTSVFAEEILDLYSNLQLDSIKNYSADYLFIQFILQNRQSPMRHIYRAMERAMDEPPSSRAERQALHKINLALYAVLGEQRQWNAIIAASDKYIAALDVKYYPYYFKAFALMQNGNYAAAKTAAEQAERHLDHADSASAAQAYAMLGDICFNLKEYSSSDKHYDKSLQYSPNNALLLNNYAYYLSLRGKRLRKALKMSAQSLVQDPSNATYLDTYAWILFKQKKYEDAKQIFRKAIMYHGDRESTILEHYGDVLFELGERDNAIIYWRRAMEIGGESAELSGKINGDMK